MVSIARPQQSAVRVIKGDCPEAEAASDAGLRYVSDQMPGITRRRNGDGFVYIDAKGARIRDEKQLARIKSLAIPPAWTDVWISADARGHLQATGRDARGRKQYRYHPQWRAHRDAGKFGRLAAFGARLPALRRQLAQDQERPGLPREKVIATIVRLMESTLIRVGNDEYARDNGSYGLTTLRTQHAAVDGSTIMFRFVGKGGKQHRISVRSRRLARIVRACRDLPGQDLFQYIGDDGEPQTIGSGDVNSYLRDAMGEEFTAKDIRTWRATVIAAGELAATGASDSAAQAKREINAAIARTAEALGNTPSVCRKCYVHPGILEAYERGETIPARDDEPDIEAELTGLSGRERAVLKLLRRIEAEESAPTTRSA